MLSYLLWLLVFVVIPIIIIWVFKWKLLLKYKKVFVFSSVGAFIVAIPWDVIAVDEKVWYFTKPHIMGIWIGGLPLEEYLFIFLQTFLFTTITLVLLGKKKKI